MSRLMTGIVVLGGAALATFSGCSGCQQTAQKTDSASPEKKQSSSASPAGAAANVPDEPASESQPREAPLPPDKSQSTASLAGKAESDARRDADQGRSSDAALSPIGNPPQNPANHAETAGASAATAAETLNVGQAALRESAKLAAAGDDAAAFQTALAGWEATRRFPNDPQLKRLTAQLLQRLKQSGEAATRKTPPDSNKASVLE